MAFVGGIYIVTDYHLETDKCRASDGINLITNEIAVEGKETVFRHVVGYARTLLVEDIGIEWHTFLQACVFGYLVHFSGNGRVPYLHHYGVYIEFLSQMHIVADTHLVFPVFLMCGDIGMQISHIEQGIMYALPATFRKQCVVDNGGFSHLAGKSVEQTVSIWAGHQIDTQWEFYHGHPSGVWLLAYIAGKHGDVHISRICGYADLVEQIFTLRKVLPAAA